MTLILAFAAGLLTLINPCVLPVLPLVLAASLQASRLGPLALAAGLSVAFVTVGLTLGLAGAALGLTDERIAQAGALAMAGFGLVLLVPAANRSFAFATTGLASHADRGIDRIGQGGAGRQFLGGLLMGAVWSPCVGPTLGGALALAAQGRDLTAAGATMAAFALGVSSVILALGYGARAAIRRHQGGLRALAERAKPITGLVFLTVGVVLLTGLHHRAEAWLISVLPPWLQDFSVSI